MLIIALVLAAIGLAALVFAVVTSNALVAWVCIGASVLGVLLLIVDALRERRRQTAGAVTKPLVADATADADDVVEDLDDEADSFEAPEAPEDSEAADAPEAPAVIGEAIGGGFDDAAVDEAAAEPAAHPAD